MFRSTRLTVAVALVLGASLPLCTGDATAQNVPARNSLTQAPAVDVPQDVPTPPRAAATPANVQGTASSTSTGDGRHTLNLKAADIGVLVQTVSEITGKSFIVDPRVEGRVTVISAKPQTAGEIYETFLSVLRVHGFAAVSSGDMVKIVPDQLAAQDGSVGNGGGGPDALVTRLVPLQHVSADDVVKLLRPLAPQQATFAAHAGSNSVLITDRAGNVERLMGLIRRIDTESDAAVEVLSLRHASAAEVARTLTTLEGGGAAQGAGAKLIADERTNSILLSGDRSQRLRLRALVAHLDTPLDGGENTQVIYLQYAKADDLVPILDGVTASLTRTQPAAPAEGGAAAKSATIQAHAETNSLIVTASPAVFREIQSVVRQLDVRRAQVLVEAIIAEVTDELADEIGVQWQSSSYDGGNDTGIIGGTNFPRAGGVGSIIAAMLNPATALQNSSGLNLGYVGGTVRLPGSNTAVLQVGALVRALRGDGRANIMSNPSVVTLDNHEAEFKVVQEVPFLTGSYTNTANGGSNQPNNPFQTVERKDVGLILTVTPHINSGDSVRLEVKQEVSSIANSVDGAVDLITNKRELTTSVMVADGGLLILGGLSEDNTRESIQGVPYLSRIPIIGNLFKTRDSSKTRRNLMVFLRPIILRDAATEAAVSGEKYNFLRTEQLRMRENHELKYEGNVLPPLPPVSIPSQPRAIESRNDLMSNPPPIPPEEGSFETGRRR